MPQPYSLDLRERVVADAAQQTQGEVAARFAVSESTVCKWCRRARETGGAVLRALVAEQNDRTLGGAGGALRAPHGRRGEFPRDLAGVSATRPAAKKKETRAQRAGA